MSEIAAIGEKDSVLAFKTLGVDVYPTDKPEEAAHTIFRLAKDGCALILITETLAKKMTDTLQKYADEPRPAIITIPGARGSEGLGAALLKSYVERAVGADINF